MYKKVPIVSVIIPVYNAEHYLEHAVNSVLEQPNSELIELLLIDDGSSDNSAVICDKLAVANNGIIVFHKENGGVSSARNLGIEHASGKYLAFLDSDDWWETGFLTNELIAELMRSDSSDIYCFSYQKVSPNRQWRKLFRIKNEVRLYEKPGLSHIIGQHHSAFLYHKDYLFKKGFRYLPTKMREDVSFTQLCCSFARSITCIDRIMFAYWINYDSCMHKRNSVDKFIEHYRSEQIVKSIYDANDLPYDIDRVIISIVGEYLRLISAEFSFGFVNNLLRSSEFDLLRNSCVQPWTELQKDVFLWRKAPFLAYIKCKLKYGMPIILKRCLRHFTYTRPLADYLQYRVIEKWSVL